MKLTDRLIKRVVERFAQTKGYSLVPVDSESRASMRRFTPEPSARDVVRAYKHSPFLHVKLARIASTLAGLPMQAGFDVNGEFTAVSKDHPFVKLWTKPNPYMRGWDFIFITEVLVRSTGSVYWRLVRDGLRIPNMLMLYPTFWVEPIRQFDPVTKRPVIVSYRVSMPDGTSEGVAVQDMMWLRTPDPEDPYFGALGDVLSLVTEIDTYEKASEADRVFFENDATPQGALVVPGMPTRQQREALQDDWRGATDGGGTPILYGGMDYRKFREGRREMDFIDGQRWLRDTIFVGVQKHILGVSDDVTFAAAKAADYSFGKWEMTPRVSWIQYYSTEVAQVFDKRLYTQFDEIVPEDDEFQLRRMSEGLQRGAATRNDWRLAAGLDAVEDGNMYLIPNTVTEVPAGPDREPFAAPPPAPPTPPPAPAGAAVVVTETKDAPAVEELPKRKKCPDGYHWNAQTEKCEKTDAPEAPHVPLTEYVDDAKPRESGLPATVSLADRISPADIAVPLADPFRPNPSVTINEAALDALIARKQSERDIVMVIQAIADDKTLEALRPMYERIFGQRFEDTAKELGVQLGIREVDPRITTYLREVAGERITHINETTRDQVREILSTGVAAGDSVSEIADALRSKFEQFMGQRAETIARTETIDASNAAALHAYVESGVVEKVEWLLAPDYDEKQDDGECAEYEASGPVMLGEDFNGPDGPMASGPAHPNCRCSVAPIVVPAEGEQNPPPDETEVDNAAIDAQAAANGVFRDMLDNPDEKMMEDIDRQLMAALTEASPGVAQGQLDRDFKWIQEAMANWRGGGPSDLNGLENIVSGVVKADPLFPHSVEDVARYKRMGDAVHTASQNTLREVVGDSKTIRVYRGFGGKEGSYTDDLASLFESHGVVNLKPQNEFRALSSWSTDRNVAENIAIGRVQVIVEADVPISWTWGSAFMDGNWVESTFLREREIIVDIRNGLDAHAVKIVRHGEVILSKGAAGTAVSHMPENEMSWHEKGKRAVKPREKGALYSTVEQKSVRIVALGAVHSRLEREFSNKVKRMFQLQYRDVANAVRRHMA